MTRESTQEDLQRMKFALNGELPWDRVALTCFALVAATVGIKTGNKVYANHMFRLRVAAQGFTVLAMVGGSLLYTYRNPKDGSIVSE
ncbi:unnamed protein product [Absidia cylindrospora]